MEFQNHKGPIIMGILNVTPDSFSDGGKYNSLKKAVDRAKQLEKEGAHIIDIGGESSGPHSKSISLKEELKRVIPIIRAIKKVVRIPVSIDTYKAKVAQESIKAGASIVNDITALRGDKKMAKLIAKLKCQVIFMYSKDIGARTTIRAKKYTDIIKTIKDFFAKQIKLAKKHGINESQIILDPGMGQFISSKAQYSYEIIARLNELGNKYPILVGISRKSFIGGDIKDRDTKGKALEALAYMNGASIIRTHDVKGVNKYLKLV